LLTEHSLEDAKRYGNTSEAQAASYDRDHPLYPYKSHGQWLKASYGMVACIILILFNGVSAFIEPFNVRKFIAAYISVRVHARRRAALGACLTDIVDAQLPTFLILIVGYNLRKHGLRFSDCKQQSSRHNRPREDTKTDKLVGWADKSGDLSGTVQASNYKRKGRLEFPDNGFTQANLDTFLEWLWVWLK
jgi:amino acid transporter